MNSKRHHMCAWCGKPVTFGCGGRYCLECLCRYGAGRLDRMMTGRS